MSIDPRKFLRGLFCEIGTKIFIEDRILHHIQCKMPFIIGKLDNG